MEEISVGDINECPRPQGEVMRRIGQQASDEVVIYQVPYSGDEKPIEVVKPPMNKDWLCRPA